MFWTRIKKQYADDQIQKGIYLVPVQEAAWQECSFLCYLINRYGLDHRLTQGRSWTPLSTVLLEALTGLDLKQQGV